MRVGAGGPVDDLEEPVPPGVAVHRDLGPEHEDLAPVAPGHRLGGVAQGVVVRGRSRAHDAAGDEGEEEEHHGAHGEGTALLAARPGPPRTRSSARSSSRVLLRSRCGRRAGGTSRSARRARASLWVTSTTVRALPVQLVEQAAISSPVGGVEVAGRLVGEEEAGLDDEGTGDGRRWASPPDSSEGR